MEAGRKADAEGPEWGRFINCPPSAPQTSAITDRFTDQRDPSVPRGPWRVQTLTMPAEKGPCTGKYVHVVNGIGQFRSRFFISDAVVTKLPP